MFHEIDPDQVDRQRGMDMTVVTTATNDAEGRSLLRRARLPVQGELTSGEEGAGRQGEAQRRSSRCARYTRCSRCGRPRAVYRRFGLCRICFRTMAHRGELPGITKSSW